MAIKKKIPKTVHNTKRKMPHKKSDTQKTVGKHLTINAIENGTVIDHIPSEVALNVAEILGLAKYTDVISIATNLPSKAVGKKGLVKVAGRYLTEQEVNKIAIVAPYATVNIIKNYRVIEKIKVAVPDSIENVIKCSNPVCITNNEEIRTRFFIFKNKELKVKCYYCEREMGKGDIRLV